MAIDWKLFQKEHRDWQVPNFGEPDPFEMHVGLVEELGELSHSILKMRQGIRGTKEEHYLAMEDAVGDMVIYYVALCSANGLDISQALEGIGDYRLHYFQSAIDEKEAYRLLVKEVATSFSSLAPRSFFRLLHQFCSFYAIPMEKSIIKTWEQVSKRDWKSNPVTGEVNG
jgi:NTP pyrophosphatase (non-canonical NTP hydrolase)